MEDNEFRINGEKPGAERISFEFVPSSTYTVVATQKNGQLVPFEAVHGEKIVLAQAGNVPVDAMFKSASDEHELFNGIRRVLCCVAIVMGLAFVAMGVFQFRFAMRP